jgi:hypothetical protein
MQMPKPCFLSLGVFATLRPGVKVSPRLFSGSVFLNAKARRSKDAKDLQRPRQVCAQLHVTVLFRLMFRVKPLSINICFGVSGFPDLSINLAFLAILGGKMVS